MSCRLLVLSDVHANWPALESVLEDAAGRYDTVWFLGDAMGYGPFPIECLEYLRDQVCVSRWRTGNHDLGIFNRVPDFAWANVASATLAIHRRELAALRPDLLTWLDGFATLERCGPLGCQLGRGQQVWTHANLENNLNIYLFPSSTHDTRLNLLRLRTHLPQPKQCAWLLAGHSHIPCLFQLPAAETDYLRARPLTIRWGEPISVAGDHYYLNPGSVGQPRDGNPAACYMLLDTQELTATWRRVEYRVDITVAEMRNKNLRFDYGYPVESLQRWYEQGGTPDTIGKLANIYQRMPDGLSAIAYP